MVWALSLSATELISRSLTAVQSLYRYSEFVSIWYPVLGPAPNQCSTPGKIHTTLRLNAFRREPASSGLDWHFTPNHNSSENFSTFTSSYLHMMLLMLHTGHG